MDALKVKNLYVEYGDNMVLEDINLKIKDKHFLGIIGPNGGGKSTLLKAIVGLVDYKKGEIKIYGKKPADLNGILGYVPQASKFDKNFPINVEEVILSGILKDNLKIFKKYTKKDKNKAKKISSEKYSNGKFVVVGSRSHMNDETREFITDLEKNYGETEIFSRGSSLKLCMVAEGKAHAYPRFAPTMEWDTGAGHAIAKSAGAKVVNNETGNELKYNKENLLNPWFLVKPS